MSPFTSELRRLHAPASPSGRSSAHSLPDAGVRSTQEARGSGAEGCWRQSLRSTEDGPDLVSSAHTWEVQSEPVHRSGSSSPGERSAGGGRTPARGCQRKGPRDHGGGNVGSSVVFAGWGVEAVSRALCTV